MELCLHFPIQLQGVVLNSLSTGATLLSFTKDTGRRDCDIKHNRFEVHVVLENYAAHGKYLPGCHANGKR
jgi:hypothetical protein